MCFLPYLGVGRVGGWGVKRDWYITCLCTFAPYSSKIGVSETYFFDIVITHNDHP